MKKVLASFFFLTLLLAPSFSFAQTIPIAPTTISSASYRAELLELLQLLEKEYAFILSQQTTTSTAALAATPTTTTTPSLVSTTQQSWIPSWLSSANLTSPSSWTTVTPYGCNADSFGATPALGNLFIGRILDNTDPSNACSGTNWSLTWATMNWSTNTVTQGTKLLDTSAGPVMLGDGNAITSAYDATAAVWNNEIWVAFECYGYGNFKYAAASSCVGPLNKDLSLNLSRTAVVVGGGSYNPSDTYGYSASVPKLLVFNGNLYLYWSVVKYPKSTPNSWTNVTTRGVQLGQEQSSLKRVWALTSHGLANQAIGANDPSSTEVFGLNASDPESDSDADLFQVVTDGKQIYFTGGRGGSGCVSPWSGSAGCYRLTIGTASTPLGQDIFDQNLIPASYLPTNPQEYYRFVYRSTDGSTVLMGGNFLNPTNNPALNTGMKLFVWPTKLLQYASLPSGYASTPAPYVQPVTTTPSTPASVSSVNPVTVSTSNSSNTSTVTTSSNTNSSASTLACGSVPVGTTLTPGESVKSCNGAFTFIFQTDGNIVLYQGAMIEANAIWASNTGGKPSARLVMQTDGNLVSYDANNAPVWATSEDGGINNTPVGGLTIQNDGNLVIYGQNNAVLWASNTGGRTP